MRMRRCWGAAVAGSVLAGALAGCSGSPATPAAASRTAPDSAPSASASPSSTLAPAAQAALTAYRQAWADAAAVEDSGNYRDTRLERHIAGNLLMTVSEYDYIEETQGVASRGAPVLHPRVSAVNLHGSPPTVTIVDCIDFSHFVQYYAATGKPYGAAQSGLSTNTSTMTLMKGSWMMTSAVTGADGSCSL